MYTTLLLLGELRPIRLTTLINRSTTTQSVFLSTLEKTNYSTSEFAAGFTEERTEAGRHLGSVSATMGFFRAHFHGREPEYHRQLTGSPLNLFGCIYRDVSFSE